MENLKSAIKDWLTNNGFSYHENNDKPIENCWYKMWTTPGGVMQAMINNEVQSQQMPDIQHSLAFNYEDDICYTSNTDGSNKVEFLLGTWMRTRGEAYNSTKIYQSIHDIQDFINVTLQLLS